MLPAEAVVSSSLTTLPAFETEHALFVAEQALASLVNGRTKAETTRPHSLALQALADAYAARRAGDRGDNLARAAALLARAASLPANSRGEKATRAAAFSRLARALLARAAIPQSGAETKDATDKSETLQPSVPEFMRLVRTPDARVERVAQKAYLAATAAADGIATNHDEVGKLKEMLDKREKDDAPDVDKKQQVDIDANAKLAPVRNLLAALHVDQARALFFGACPQGAGDDADERVARRTKAAIRALKLAAKLRLTTNRRERAAGALADVMLAILYAREKCQGEEPSEGDRVKAARLLRTSGVCLSALFGAASDSDSTVSDSPPVSPTRVRGEEFAQGSDCSEESLGKQRTACADKNGEDSNEVNWDDAIMQDAFEPFLGWDLDDVRRFIDGEIKRLGPVMQDSDNRRSCVLV